MTAIEYGLIAAGISVAIIAVVNTIGTNLHTTFGTIGTQLGAQNAAAGGNSVVFGSKQMSSRDLRLRLCGLLKQIDERMTRFSKLHIPLTKRGETLQKERGCESSAIDLVAYVRFSVFDAHQRQPSV